MSDSKHLPLSVAAKDGRLQDFIAQEEARGVPPVATSDFIDALDLTIKQPRSEEQTSRSASRGGLSEK